MLHLATQAGLVLAQEDTAADGGGTGFLLIWLLVLGGLFYFMLFRPQRKQRDRQLQLQNSIEVGDEIRTVGGIYGRVKTVTEGDLIIDVGNGTTLRVAMRAVAARLGVDDE